MSRLNETILVVGKVREVENVYSKDGADALRVRAEIMQDHASSLEDIPWAFPLMPKTFQSVPKVGEAVLIIMDRVEDTTSQRYYIGPIISQPQFMEYCTKEDATTLLQSKNRKPIGMISNNDSTRGSFPNASDIAVVGRGEEDVTLKYDKTTNTSEVNIRAGIRQEPSSESGDDIKGNVIFNEIDPAYIQVKRKNSIATKSGHEANSIVNVVADRVNIMSNRDDAVSHDLHDKETLVAEERMDEIMDSLHQVPMGDKLVELLELMRGAIMNHVHPWPGMPQSGDWHEYVNKLSSYDINSILSDYVRIS